MLLDYLRKEFRTRKKKNKLYSIRAFADSLKVDSSTLSKILIGKRKISYPFAKKIVAALRLDDTVKSILLLHYADTEKPYLLEEDFFVPDEKISAALMSRWQYYGILSYLEIDNRLDIKKIAKIFEMTESLAGEIIENFIQLGIVILEKDRLILTGKRLTAPSTFDRNALINCHKENIHKAIASLDEVESSQRDISGITIAISSKKLVQAVNSIKDFRRSLMQALNDPNEKEDCVYRLNIQFFPLIQKIKS